ncbi:MAG: CpaD family pilus assembly protein [Hyphomicrobiaceae bacterium]
MPSIQSVRRASSLVLTAAACLAALTACRDRLDAFEAARLDDPRYRHAIGFSSGIESLRVELAASGANLEPHQRADVARFIERYRRDGVRHLTIATSTGERSQIAVRSALGDIRGLIEEVGLDPGRVEVQAGRARSGYLPVLELSFVKPKAVAPVCPDWSDDVARTREALNMANHGCADRNNFAVMVAHPRDLLHPQDASPRSSEKRMVDWRAYRGEASGNAPASTAPPSQSLPPGPAAVTQ